MHLADSKADEPGRKGAQQGQAKQGGRSERGIGIQCRFNHVVLNEGLEGLNYPGGKVTLLLHCGQIAFINPAVL